MKPGIYPDLPETDYHALDYVSSSGLARIDRSPAHYRVPIQSSPSMVLGSLVHCLVLEPDLFDERYAVAPDCDRRTKAGKETWQAFMDASDGLTLIKPQEHEQAQAMAKAVADHQDAMDILMRSHEHEVSLIWDEDGARCKARCDIVTATGACDLKTTRDASPGGFSRAIASYLYHQQAAHYLRGLAALKRPADSWQWICVEPLPPYAVGVYTASSEMLEEGDRRRARNMARLAACKFADDWPAYDSQTLNLPGWAHITDLEWSEAA